MSTTESCTNVNDLINSSLRGIRLRGDVNFSFRGNMEANFNGKRLAQARIAFGWTQTELAHQVTRRFPSLSIAPQSISSYELDSRTPSFEVAVALAVVLETSLDYLSNITEYDRGVNGNDEVTVVVHTEQQKTDMRSIAYPFLELSDSDRQMVLDLVRRLSADGNDVLTANEKRFRKVIAALADKLGSDIVRDIAEVYGARIDKS